MRIEMLLLVQSFAFRGYNSKFTMVKKEFEEAAVDDWKMVDDFTDEIFFESLIPFVSSVKQAKSMEMRSQMIILVKKYAYAGKDVKPNDDSDDGTLFIIFL